MQNRVSSAPAQGTPVSPEQCFKPGRTRLEAPLGESKFEREQGAGRRKLLLETPELLRE